MASMESSSSAMASSMSFQVPSSASVTSTLSILIPDKWRPALKDLLIVVVLALICSSAILSRLFAVIRFESIIHEFDPWFNYRATSYMVENSWDAFLNWFDDTAWYPLGRFVGITVFPGLMVTSGAIYHTLHALNIPVHIREICVFLAPLFSGLTAISAFLLTKELADTGAGLLAAAFIGIAPGYISRSVAGSYDNEGIAIFALLFTFWLWLRSCKTGSVFWAGLASLSYFYMVSAWGGYVFITNLVPLHVLVLLLMNRYSSRLYTSYSTFYVIGTLLSMQVPFVGFKPVTTSEHMSAAGVFALLQAFMLRQVIVGYVNSKQAIQLFQVAVVGVAGVVFVTGVMLTWAGYIAPWTGRFYSLWDTGYAKIHIPIIASVSEHQPTTWTSFFFDLHILIAVFPAGVYFVLQKLRNERVFIVLYAVLAVYFAGVMVRLMLTLTPVVCVVAAIAFSTILKTYLSNGPIVEENGKKKKLSPMSSESSIFIIGILGVIFVMFVLHCNWVTSNAYSSPSVVLSTRNSDGSRAFLDDFREAYQWLRHNTPEGARIMSWWDYGYQQAGMGDAVTLVDNFTANNTSIAVVGKAMASNETVAYDIMRQLDVDYVFVVFGGVIGYSGDDINKFLWMVRIAEAEFPTEVSESDFFTPSYEYRVDSSAPKTFRESLMYKMSYYRFSEVMTDYQTPAGYDRVRNTEIGEKNIVLEHIEEAYTTEHWMVRIYKVKKYDNRDKSNESFRAASTGQEKRRQRRGSASQGYIHNKPKRESKKLRLVENA